MSLPRQPFLKYILFRLLTGLALLLIAAQCQSPSTPPPPVTPAGSTVRLALLTPSSGELATFGRLLRNGSLMALAEWNDRGGLLDQRLEWTGYDSGCEFESGGQAARQAIADGQQIIIGPLCSEAAIAAAAEAETAGVLLISPTATHPLVTVNPQGQTRPTVFRVSHPYPALGQAAARFAYDSLNLQKAALVFDTNDPYARDLAETFAGQLMQQGGEVVYQGSYSPTQTDFTELLQAIRQAAPEVIYLPLPVDIVNQLAGQLHEFYTAPGSPPPPILLGSDSWDSPELDLEATAGSYFTSQLGPTDSTPALRQWADAYRAAYAVEPDTLAILGYEATHLLLTAIEQSGSLDPRLIAATMEQDTFTGLTGEISFDQRHNPRKPIPVLQVKDGQIQMIQTIQP